MCQHAAVAVAVGATVAERHALPDRKRGDGALRVFRQRPVFEVLAAEGEFWRLQADQAHLASVGEKDRIAVHRLAHDFLAARDQIFAGARVREWKRRRDQGENGNERK